MSSIRKSTRVRTLTPKMRTCLSDSTNKQAIDSARSKRSRSEDLPIKRRRIVDEEDNSDKIDPVEKLLSLPNLNNDILLDLAEEASERDEDEEDEEEDEDETRNELVPPNFTKILHDNIRSYYSNFRKSPIEIYNDNSSFAFLNKKEEPDVSNFSSRSNSNAATASLTTPLSPQTPTSNVPFFRNVNFSGSSRSDYTIDDYFSYDELTDNDTEESLSPTDKPGVKEVSPATSTSSVYFPDSFNNKMSFHYRHNHSNLNLSDGFDSGAVSPLSPGSTVDLPNLNYGGSDNQDIFKYLNKRSVLSGKASEMVGTGKFLINDFFL